MKFFRLDLLTLLISLFILNSCKNQDTIGLGVQSSNQLNGTLVDTATITTNTVLDDTVLTSANPVKNPLGYFKDPIFGTTVSDLATDLNLPGSSAYTLPTGTIFIDSARLVLKYENGFYGDSLSSTYKVNVYQLNEQYKTNTAYYNNKIWNYNSSNLLGSATFNARPNGTVKIYNIIKGAPDTLITAAAQIRVPINTSFINSNLFNASSTTLSSNAIFGNLVKGLYITLDKSKTTGSGGIMMLSGKDSLAVYYRAVNGATIDTSVVYLPVVNAAAAVQHTYTTAIQTELSNTTTSRPVLYLQGLGSLRAKISFPALLSNLRASLAKTGNDIVINRAELVVTPSAGTTIPFAPVPKLSMYRLDIAHQRAYVEDATTSDPRSGGVSVFGGFFSPSTNEYHFIVTAYLQDLILGKTIDYGTYIAPIDNVNTTAVDIAATTQVASRTVAVGGSANSPYKMKLNIIYTKIAK